MARIELVEGQILCRVEVRDGRRVLVLIDVFDKNVSGGGVMTYPNEVVIELNEVAPDRSVRLLARTLEAVADLVQAEARHDAHRGGKAAGKVISFGGPEASAPARPRS